MKTDRRRHPRFEIAAQIRVKHGQVNYVMDIANISLSGAFVSADEIQSRPWFRVDQVLEMDIFAFEELENIQLKARIVRVVPDGGPGKPGFGVQFIGLADDTRDRLFRLVDLAARQTIEPPPLPGGAGPRSTEDES